jgi:carboxyl-terminal processing protease
MQRILAYGIKQSARVALILCAFTGSLGGSLGAEEAPPQSANGVATFEAAWQIINDSYFDPTFHGVDWKAVRTELLPRAKQAKSAQELRAVIQEMLDRVGGSHMSLIPRELAHSIETLRQNPETEGNRDDASPAEKPPSDEGTVKPNKPSRAARGEGDFGFDLRVSDQGPLVSRVDSNSPAAKAGIQSGWLLRTADGEPVQTTLASVPRELNSREQRFIAWELLTGKLSGKPGSTGSIQFLDGTDQPVTLTLERRAEPGAPTKLGFLPTLYSRIESRSLKTPARANAGCIWFNLWMVPILKALDEKVDEFRHADGLVVDMRGNFGGLGGMILGVSGYFLGERVSLGTLRLRGNELQFFSNPRLVNAAGEPVKAYAGPLAILIDDLTLSAAEIFAGGMQAIGRARVFGQRSGGQALPAVWDKLPNGDVLYHAIGDFMAANGKRIEGNGVTPDELIPLSRKDLLQGHDAPLEAALRWIDEENRKR